MSAGRLVAVSVGTPREIRWSGRRVTTAIYKAPVDGRRHVGRLNVDGDDQADRVGHGGEHRAVFVYQRESYAHWERELGRDDLTPGRFGENFTVDGLGDGAVCIGDRFEIGSALFEVSQPRVTCFKVGIRMEEPRMPSLLVGHGRPGFYLRVLREGKVGAGDEIRKVAQGPAAITVREASALLYLPGHRPERLRRALAIPALSEGWRASFAALLDQHGADGNAGLGPPTPAPGWTGFRPFLVTRIRRETAAVRSFTLAPADGGRVEWLPGQFVTLRLEPADGEPPIVRSYSISRGHGAGDVRISVKREPGGRASGHLHTAVRVGDVLEVAAPRGSFTLDPGNGGPVVLLSAGIGVTPVLAMLESLARTGSRRDVWWVHGARSAEEHAFADEARALLAELAGARCRVRYSRDAGRIDLRALEAVGVPRDADFFLCGPAGFLRDLSAGLRAWGVDGARVHVETFGAATVAAGGPAPHPPSGPPGTGPQVTFARSGLSVSWAARYGSLLELAEACDVRVSWSCRTGVCRTCETGLVDGAVDYQPDPLERAAAGHALICCARPRGAVTLDL